MYNKLTVFDFYFWSAEAENSDKKIVWHLLLECSTAYFFFLDHHKSWISTADPITFICLLHEQFLVFLIFFSYFIKYTVLSKLVFAQLTEI